MKKFQDFDNYKIYYVSEGCTIILQGKNVAFKKEQHKLNQERNNK